MVYEVPHTEPWEHCSELGVSLVEQEGETGDLARELATQFPGIDVDLTLCMHGNETCIAVLAKKAEEE